MAKPVPKNTDYLNCHFYNGYENRCGKRRRVIPNSGQGFQNPDKKNSVFLEPSDDSAIPGLEQSEYRVWFMDANKKLARATRL
jgi:hypothetical protein